MRKWVLFFLALSFLASSLVFGEEFTGQKLKDKDVCGRVIGIRELGAGKLEMALKNVNPPNKVEVIRLSAGSIMTNDDETISLALAAIGRDILFCHPAPTVLGQDRHFYILDMR